jgi:NADPH-dependent 2,4-dienoyl-CoA reductase/sulfur reductase-like enzyme
MEYPQGWQVHLAEKVREKVRIPIVAMGKIKHPPFAESILKDGKADMVAIGRALIADPELVTKAQKNEVDRILPCISCNNCIDRVGDHGKALRCSVNPMAGREYDTRIVPAARSKKVVIVGGGPAGMQAAISAASRGQDVVLMEKSNKLGGQLLLASTPPNKEEINSFTDYLCMQLKYNKVNVKMDTKVTGDVLNSMTPEVVVLATGASPLMPAIPGSNLSNVITS